MADTKISALTAATTPLAGTEVLPIVQSSTTKKVAVSDLTVGRAVTATSFTASTQTGFVGSSGDTNFQSNWIYFKNTAGTTEYGRWTSGGDLINYNNFIQGTAAKGINFTANTGAAGMTSQLFNWYEEGTWTPADASGAGLSFTVTTAKYVRVGKTVFILMDIRYPATANANAAAISGLPFSASGTNSVATTVLSGGATPVLFLTSGSTMYARTFTNTNITNATLSGVTVISTFTYGLF